MLRITLYICSRILVSGLVYTRQEHLLCRTVLVQYHAYIYHFLFSMPTTNHRNHIYVCIKSTFVTYLRMKKQTRLTRTLLPSLMHDLAYL